MKAKSRKRLLISSTSMLLVSALALGTATFAWFTNNKKVTADGMTVTAAAAKGLQITGTNGQASDDITDDNWGSSYSFTLSEKTLLNAISVPYSNSATAYNKFPGTVFYPSNVSDSDILTTTNATNFSNWVSRDSFPEIITSKGTEASKADNYMAVYQVGIRMTENDNDYGADDPSKPSAKSINAKVKFTPDAAKDAKVVDYLRVAVLEAKTAPNTAVANTGLTKVLAKAKDTTAIASVNGSGVATLQNFQENVAVADADGATTWSFDGIDIDSPKYYTIVVWVEGQDPECVDANISLTGKINLEFWYD